jgi:hypothetical protein
LPDRENYTTACPPMGAGVEHCKAPKKTITIKIKIKKLQLPAQDPNPTKKNQIK